MFNRTFFHLDCNAILPECGFQCPRCIAEIRTVLETMEGVTEVSLESREEISGILVRYDPKSIDQEVLLNAFRKLPSFYRNCFDPRVTDAG